MKLSIIIPTYNEEAVIGDLLEYLQRHISDSTEIILADGGSTDTTRDVARAYGVKVLLCKRKGRGPQMNCGAAAAAGELFYFLHADTLPPPEFEQQLTQAVNQGSGSGCYRLRFNVRHWFLGLNAWFTRFNVDALRFGDQSLFARRDLFEAVGGFDERMLLLEDQEIITRLRRQGPFTVLPQQVVTSARKYRQHGVYRLQFGYFLIYALYRLGASQGRLVQVYQRLLK